MKIEINNNFDKFYLVVAFKIQNKNSLIDLWSFIFKLNIYTQKLNDIFMSLILFNFRFLLFK
jgi:hypothetical protein